MNIQKVFCIGFHKTGTKSLATALQTLGFRVTGPNGVNDKNIKVNFLPMALKLADQFDAFQDNPWPLLYKKMDKLYPNSKFILSTRNPNQWIKSAISHFGENETPMRELLYGRGSPIGNESIYLELFEKHIKEVRHYFHSRPKDLLEIDITTGEGWEAICPFLNKDKPTTPFPHTNKAKNYR